MLELSHDPEPRPQRPSQVNSPNHHHHHHIIQVAMKTPEYSVTEGISEEVEEPALLFPSLTSTTMTMKKTKKWLMWIMTIPSQSVALKAIIINNMGIIIMLLLILGLVVVGEPVHRNICIEPFTL
jgi:hypothetical protein